MISSIIMTQYAIRQVKPMDTYRKYYAELLTWILPERAAWNSSVVIAADDYRADSTKEGNRRSRRGSDEGRRVYLKGWTKRCQKEVNDLIF